MKVVGTAKSASGLCSPSLRLRHWNFAHNTSRNDFAMQKFEIYAMVRQRTNPAQHLPNFSILIHSSITASVAFALCRLRLWSPYLLNSVWSETAAVATTASWRLQLMVSPTIATAARKRNLHLLTCARNASDFIRRQHAADAGIASG